ncbi:MAG: hypothetical protein JKY15_04850, partial [Deltaproteobacteria bacterium]|nr:hypothetical protein [Deltaproteobacteria bacterium]
NRNIIYWDFGKKVLGSLSDIGPVESIKARHFDFYAQTVSGDLYHWDHIQTSTTHSHVHGSVKDFGVTSSTLWVIDKNTNALHKKDLESYQSNTQWEEVSNIKNAHQISTGIIEGVRFNSVCFTFLDQTAQCFNEGNGYNSAKEIPIPAEWQGSIQDISPDESYICAVLTGGSTKCCRTDEVDSYGASKTPPDLPPAIIVKAAQERSCIMTPDSFVDCWGKKDYLNIPQSLLKIDLQVSNPNSETSIIRRLFIIGYHASCAIDSTNTIVCWGHSDFGGDVEAFKLLNGRTNIIGFVHQDDKLCLIQPGKPLDCPIKIQPNNIKSVPNTMKPFLDVADNKAASYILKTNHQLRSLGHPDFYPPEDLGEVEEIAAAGHHACAVLKADKIVRCWGQESGNGQLNVPSNLGSILPPMDGGKS